MNECVGMCVCLCVRRCMRVCACVYVYVWFCEPQTKAVNGISLRCSRLLPLICVSLHLSLQTPKGLIMHHSASLLIPNLHLRCLRRKLFFYHPVLSFICKTSGNSSIIGCTARASHQIYYYHHHLNQGMYINTHKGDIVVA